MALQIRRSRIPELLIINDNMSQAEFARRIGVSESFITRVISNEKHLSYLRAKRASTVLNCTMEDLVEWEEV